MANRVNGEACINRESFVDGAGRGAVRAPLAKPGMLPALEAGVASINLESYGGRSSARLSSRSTADVQCPIERQRERASHDDREHPGEAL